MKASITFFVLLTSVLNALSWSEEGHRVIATVAYSRLTSHAKAKVDALLGSMSIENAATWPDDIRPGGKVPPDIAEANAFNSKFKENAVWHYVDLPLGATTFPTDHLLAHSSNIVEMINHCILLLEGTETWMPREQAIRWLVHLVGDLHQPLHAGCAYFRFPDPDPPQLVADPLAATTAESDHGGNRIDIPGPKKLHSFWDTNMVGFVRDANPGRPLADVLSETIAQAQFKKVGGSRLTWARKWALESVVVASQAYTGIDLGTREATSSGWKINAAWNPSEAGYQSAHADLAKTQLAKGAFNLARLLNTIHWP